MTDASAARLTRQTEEPHTTQEGKYLTFTLGDEYYGLSILKVKEIIGIMPITAVPQAPEYVNGVVNLRGKVIPVIDLRRKFAMPTVDYTDRTCIIVIETEKRQGRGLTGIVVDAVADVTNIKGDNIEDPPDFSAQTDSAFILGMAKTEGGVKILLDIDRVVGGEELAVLEEETV